MQSDRSDVKLEDLLRPAIEAESCELWGIDYLSKARPPVLRVYIDRADGIDVDHCAAVSRQISAILDVEEFISGQYTLEVSSPGTDRPLFTPEQFAKYVGENVRIRSLQPLAGRRRFSGKLLRVTQDGVELAVDDKAASSASNSDLSSEANGICVIAFALIDRANLNPTFSFG